MMQKFNKYRFVFGAGGTGGHLYPALAVAEKIREIKPDAEITFFGNKNKIEGKVVPKAGFRFKHIDVVGFHRGELLRNIMFPFKTVLAFFQALFSCIRLKPRVAVGSGAYVSGPVLLASDIMGAKLILMEQNSYPGITNRLLDKKAAFIFTAFEETKKYFREKDKVVFVGNPVRDRLVTIDKITARNKLGIREKGKVVFVVGGSLGAKSINETIKKYKEKFEENGIILLWQTGKTYYNEYKSLETENIRIYDFIDDITLFYAASDLVIARAGATTIAELSFVGKASILIPSPNVAENHQFKNAEELAKIDAIVMIPDDEIESKLFYKTLELLDDKDKLKRLETNIKHFSKPNATETIAKKAIELAEKY